MKTWLWRMALLCIFLAVASLTYAQQGPQGTSELQAQQQRFFAAGRQGDWNSYTSLLASDFTTAEPYGRLSRQHLVQRARGFVLPKAGHATEPTKAELPGMRVTLKGDEGVVEITQEQDSKRKNALGQEHTIHSTRTDRYLWRKTGAGWQLKSVSGVFSATKDGQPFAKMSRHEPGVLRLVFSTLDRATLLGQ